MIKMLITMTLLLATYQYYEQKITGTYSYCSFDCYTLTLNNDSSFLLIDKHGELDIIRTSKGVFSITDDTLTIEEITRFFKTSIRIDSSSDKLETHKFIILPDGQLQSQSFVFLNDPRRKNYSYFKKI